MINLNFLSKIQITIFNKSFIIYIVSFYRYKLMSHWFDFYTKYAVKPLKNIYSNKSQQNVLKKNMNIKYSFSIDEYISIIFMSLMAIRGLYASFVPSYAAHPTLPIYFGSFFQMMKVHPFHVEFLYFLWSTNYLANIFVAAKFTVKDFTWIEVIRFFEGQVGAKMIGLTETEGFSLKKQAQFVLTVVHLSAVSVASITMALFAMFCYIKYYPHFEYLIFNFIWFLLYTNYTIQMTYMIYM